MQSAATSAAMLNEIVNYWAVCDVVSFVIFSVRSSIRGYGAKQTKKQGAQTATPRPKQTMGDVVTKRMLSARRLKINELKVCC